MYVGTRPKATRPLPPFTWATSFRGGTVWHSPQATAFDRPPVRWTLWRPTPRAVVAALPFESLEVAVAPKPGAAKLLPLATGWAARAEEISPWQAVQPVGLLTVPSTWLALAAAVTEVEVKPAWQSPQTALCGCFTVALIGPGGEPWQEVQVSVKVAPKVPVQESDADAPPVKLPWQ